MEQSSPQQDPGKPFRSCSAAEGTGWDWASPAMCAQQRSGHGFLEVSLILKPLADVLYLPINVPCISSTVPVDGEKPPSSI